MSVSIRLDPTAREHEPARERTITWSDPLEVAGAAHGRSGLEHLRAMASGEVPPAPIAELLEFGPVDVEPGRVVFRMEPQEFHYNPIGSVHGGVAATLLDSALGCAVQTMLPPGVGYTTLELKVNYVRPIAVGQGAVRAEGRIVHLGTKVATAEGRIVRERDGKLVAHASTTCLILRPGNPDGPPRVVSLTGRRELPAERACSGD
jgi:uncharacterized protein (TIGR00369 family)